MSIRGIVLIAQGDNARQQAEAAIGRLGHIGAPWPVAVVADRPLAPGTQHVYIEDRAGDPGARGAKVSLDRLSPFDHTLYMDADTRAISTEIAIGFDLLDDGWELVITLSDHQGDDWLWHVGDEERRITEEEVGARVAVLQGGVFWFRKCDAMARLFAMWRDEWSRFGGAGSRRALARDAARAGQVLAVGPAFQRRERGQAFVWVGEARAMMDRRLARFRVDYKFLADVLHLPEGARIIQVNPAPPELFDPRWFEIYVEHDDLPLVREGEVIPVIVPLFQVEIQEENRVPNRVVTCDWNLGAKGK